MYHSAEQELPIMIDDQLASSVSTLREQFDDQDESDKLKVKDLQRQLAVYQLNSYIPPEVILSGFEAVQVPTSLGPAYPSTDGSQAWIVTANGVRLYASNKPIFKRTEVTHAPNVDDMDFIADDEADEDTGRKSCLQRAARLQNFNSVDQLLDEFEKYLNVDDNGRVVIDTVGLQSHPQLKQLDSAAISCIMSLVQVQNEVRTPLSLFGRKLFIGNRRVNMRPAPRPAIRRVTRSTRQQYQRITTGQIINGYQQFRQLTGGDIDSYADALHNMYPNDAVQINEAVKQLKLVNANRPQNEQPPCVPSRDWRLILFYKLIFDPAYHIDVIRILLLPTLGQLQLFLNAIFAPLRNISIFGIRPFGWLPIITVYETVLAMLAIRSYEVMCTFLKFRASMTLGLPISQEHFAQLVANGKNVPHSAKLSFEQRRVLSLIVLGYNAYQRRYVSVDHVRRVLGNVLILR